MCHFDRCGPFLHALLWNIKMFMLIGATLHSHTHATQFLALIGILSLPLTTLKQCVICGQCGTFFHSLLDPTSHKHSCGFVVNLN